MSEQIESLLEQAKAVVRHRAYEAHLQFDMDDIRHIELQDGYSLMALMNTKHRREFIGEDGALTESEVKTPTIWIEYLDSPDPLPLPKARYVVEARIMTARPRLCVKYPQCVLLIRPDGTYEGGRSAESMLQAVLDAEYAEMQLSMTCPQKERA